MKRAVITGATAGLGRQTADDLAAKGFDVTLAVRDAAAGERVAEELTARYPSAVVRVRILDLADLDSVRAGATQIAADGPVDVLVNNAGLNVSGPVRRTVQGFELHVGVNHVGHFVLTARLMPTLRQAERPRVVSVSSLTYRAAGQFDPRWTGVEPYRPMRAYAQSKLACGLFGLELDRRAKVAGAPLVSVVAHPGWVASDLFTPRAGDRDGFGHRVLTASGRLVAARPAAGARSHVRAALDPDLHGGEVVGPRFLFRGAPRLETPGANLRDRNSARILWELSEDRTGETISL